MNSREPRFSDEVRQSDAVAELMPRMTVVADPAISSNVAARIAIRTRDGAVHECRIDSPLGSWDRPLPDDELIAKFRSLALPVLGTERMAKLEGKVLALDNGTDPLAIASLLAGSA